MTTLKEEEERTGLAGGKDAQSGSQTQEADLTVLTGWGEEQMPSTVLARGGVRPPVACAVSVQVMWPRRGGLLTELGSELPNQKREETDEMISKNLFQL